jgi:hypothetical protein
MDEWRRTTSVLTTLTVLEIAAPSLCRFLRALDGLLRNADIFWLGEKA